MKNKRKKAGQGLTMGARFRYAVSDVRHRLGVVIRPVLAITIGTGIFLILTFYGYGFFRYHRDLISSETLTHITAMCEDISDRSIRFTEDRLAELNHRDDIAVAYPKIEQGVSLSAGIAGQIHIPAEGIDPNDPRLHSDKFEWIAAETMSDDPWIVVSRQVLYKLGGAIQDGELRPSSFVLKVARRKDGRDEQLELPVTIRGVLKRQKMDRAYIPLELALRIDQYTSHKINALSDDDSAVSGSADYEYAHAYVRAENKSRLKEDAEYLNVKMSATGSVEVLVADSLPVWGVIQGVENKEVLEPVTSAVPGAKCYPEHTATLRTPSGSITVVALSDDDPRWDLVPGGIPQTGHLIAKNVSHRGLNLIHRPFGIQVETVCESLPVTGDLVCSHETLGWLHFNPAADDSVKHETVLVTDSIATAQAMRAVKLDVHCDQPTAWRIFSVKNQPVSNSVPAAAAMSDEPEASGLMAINQRLTDLPDTGAVSVKIPEWTGVIRSASPARVGIIEKGTLAVEYGNGTRGTAFLQTRIIPDELFQIMTNDADHREDRDKEIPCLLSGRLPGGLRGCKLTVGDKRLDMVSFSVFEKDTSFALWVPESAVDGLISNRVEHAVAVWGAWDHVLDAEQRLADVKYIGQLLSRGNPSRFWTVAPASYREFVDQIAATDPGVRHANLWTSSTDFERIATIAEQDGLSDSVVGNLLSEHRRQTWLDQETFCAEVFRENAGKYMKEALRFPRYAVCVPSPLGYQVLARHAANQGAPLEGVTAIRKEVWERYRITDKSTDDGRVADSLLRVVGMTKPTFAAAEPFLSIAGEFGTSEMSLVGTSESDPLQFDARVQAGRWVSDGDVPEIVLSSAAGEAALVGQYVQVKFQREDPVTHRTEDLAMALQVVGVADGATGYVPATLVRNLTRWARNECVFNTTQGTFETPMEMYERRGFIRANIVATDAESVEPLVQWLETEGYRTENGLGELAGLQQLGRSLAIIVVFFSVGALLNAAISVWSTTAMNIDSKSWEIGLLKALSVGDREILTIFLIQGMIIGFTGFIGAVGLAALVEPLFLRSGLASVFGSGISAVIQGSILNPGNWFLIAAAFGVSLGFSLAGMAVPALKACRMLPVEALSRKE